MHDGSRARLSAARIGTCAARQWHESDGSSRNTAHRQKDGSCSRKYPDQSSRETDMTCPREDERRGHDPP
jgi:hypothetical protein